MPSAPALETAAASRGTAAIGAWTIGFSIPSSSPSEVLMSSGVPAPLRYDSYEVGVDCGERRSQP